MPSPERPSTNAAEAENPQEQLRHRTIALRVNEELHSQLSFIAQLCGSSISEEIRRAIEGRIASAGSDPDLIARAQEVREEIEREAAARTAAIAGFMGKSAVGSTTEAPRTRRSSKITKE